MAALTTRLLDIVMRAEDPCIGAVVYCGYICSEYQLLLCCLFVFANTLTVHWFQVSHASRVGKLLFSANLKTYSVP